MDVETLDAIGILEGTNKSSFEQDYLRHYERLFRGLRENDFQLIEIGVAEGGSLRTWERFFPNATIVGVDNRPVCKTLERGRVRIEIGSQSDTDFLDYLAQKYQPYIIVDDGSHVTEDILLSFRHLFSSLQPGGCYVLEDLFLHYGSNASHYRRPGDTPVADYLSWIGRSLSGNHVASELSDDDRRLIPMIDSIEFIYKAAIVRKREDPGAPSDRVSYLWDLAERSGHAINWFQLALVLFRYHDLEQAEIAAQRAVDLAPSTPRYLYRLAFLQEKCGRFASAAETARRAACLDPASQQISQLLARIESNL
jgi:tetratricopeptide (TPR) repeat protein